MSTKRRAYQISILAGGKIFAGLTENALVVKPVFETILERAQYGKPVDQLMYFDVEMSVSGLTYLKSESEDDTHMDFTEMRETASSGGSIAFVYGNVSDGKIVYGSAKITEYNEFAGSSKSSAPWSLKLKGERGTVVMDSEITNALLDDSGSQILNDDGSYIYTT